MRIEPLIENTNPFFKMTQKPPTKYVYAPNCWNELTVGKYKDYSIKVYNNYINSVHASTMICISKAGKWIKSKLKYFEDGKRKELWSYAK